MDTRDDWPAYRAALMDCALGVSGGHLAIHPGGYTLRDARHLRIQGYDVDGTQAASMAAGLPVIDTRMLSVDATMSLATCPMVAVGEPASPEPWCFPSRAPLAHVAALHRQAGAEVINVNFPSQEGAP